MKTYGGQTMWGQLRRVVVRRPDAAFGAADPTVWHYTSRPDLSAALDEHAALVSILSAGGGEVTLHDEPLPDHADAIFCHDPALITDAGAILLRMGKPLRRGEERGQPRQRQGDFFRAGGPGEGGSRRRALIGGITRREIFRADECVLAGACRVS